MFKRYSFLKGWIVSAVLIAGVGVVYSQQTNKTVRVLYSQDFDSSPCGSVLPKGLSSAANDVTTNELSRWVQNADAFSPPNALTCDFTQLEAGTRGTPAKDHGWLSWWVKPSTNGWNIYKIAFKGECGGFRGEIRGVYKNGETGRPRWWIAYWLTVSDVFYVRSEHGHPRVSIGKVPGHAWCEAELRLPTAGQKTQRAFGRINTRDAAGRMVPGPWVEIPLGGQIMTGPYNLMQIGGFGKSRFKFDNFLFEEENDQ